MFFRLIKGWVTERKRSHFRLLYEFNIFIKPLRNKDGVFEGLPESLFQPHIRFQSHPLKASSNQKSQFLFQLFKRFLSTQWQRINQTFLRRQRCYM